jgi:prepilin-type N-terminal cleavage/methylation domain-containing protein/prepilin-type processing-associated H-X9-DG protein
MNKKGFTLIELLVVIAIISILAAILFPVFAKAKESAKATAGLAQMKQLSLSLAMYTGDWDGVLVPSTNYDAPEDDPNRIWTPPLFPYAKNKGIFIAPGANFSEYAEDWSTRGWQSVGMSDVTAYSSLNGRPEEKICDTGELRFDCSAFWSAATSFQMASPADTAIFATTPNGPVEKKYRGFVFGADNGTYLRPDYTSFTDLKQAVPLASDRDLVKELTTHTPAQLKPVMGLYHQTGEDDGRSPIVFADGHAKSYTAKAIQTGGSGIIWRFR